MTLAQALRHWRRRYKLTQAQAAEFWNVTRVHWGLMERGQRPVVGPLARIMEGERQMVTSSSDAPDPSDGSHRGDAPTSPR